MPEPFRLLAHIVHQIRTHDAIGKAWEFSTSGGVDQLGRRASALVAGCALFFLTGGFLNCHCRTAANTAFYIFTLTAGYLALLMSGLWMSRLYRHNLMRCVDMNEEFHAGNPTDGE